MRLGWLKTHVRIVNWPIILLYSGIFAALGAALFGYLDTLTPGYSASELHTYRASLDWRGLLENPLNAPFLLAVQALTHIYPDTLLVTRIASAGFGVLVLGAFAILLRRWHGAWTAVIGTLLFGLSAWFLHTARLGTPEVLLFGVFLLVACGFWLKKSQGWLPLLLCFLLGALLLYVPGMIWFIALGLIMQWRALDRLFKRHLVAVTIGGLLVFAALVPLGWALYHDRSLIMPLLGLPEQWPTPLVMLENLFKVPFHLFIHNAANPVAWLGTAPILDVFSLVMFILGGYIYLQHGRLLRTPLFVAIFALSTVLMALGSPLSFTVIIPFVYIIIAAGVSRLIDQWLVVFPRNPIAKSVGWTGIALIVGLACAYQITHYFVGWPQAAATKEVFTVQEP